MVFVFLLPGRGELATFMEYSVKICYTIKIV